MKTIIRKEQWKFTCQYQSFHVDEHAWYSKMTKESKLKHYKRVQSAHYKVPVPSSSSNLAIGLGTKKLSVSFKVLKDVDILPTTLVGIWQKAESLLSNHHIVIVPWSENVKDRLVKSASSDVPHVVKVKRTNLFSCDSSCSMYTGFSICAHVVASAEDNGELSSYLNTFTSSFNAPNLTAIATQGLPGGAGRKGGRTKRKRAAKTPIESVSTRVCFSNNTDDSSFMCSSASSTLSVNLGQPSTPGPSVNLGQPCTPRPSVIWANPLHQGRQ